MPSQPRKSLKEAAKRGVVRKQPAPEVPPPAPVGEKVQKPIGPVPGAPRKPKEKPVVVGTDMVKAACGHEVPVDIYPDSADKFREGRKAKAARRKCKPCREAAEAEQRKLTAERRKIKAARQRAQIGAVALLRKVVEHFTPSVGYDLQPTSLLDSDPLMQQVREFLGVCDSFRGGVPPRLRSYPEGRLPDESRFDVVYDAKTQSWKGALSIPLGFRNHQVFSDSYGGVFGLLQKLDQQYRKWERERKGDADGE